jgi:hypothetical protein
MLRYTEMLETIKAVTVVKYDVATLTVATAQEKMI